MSIYKDNKQNSSSLLNKINNLSLENSTKVSKKKQNKDNIKNSKFFQDSQSNGNIFQSFIPYNNYQNILPSETKLLPKNNTSEYSTLSTSHKTHTNTSNSKLNNIISNTIGLVNLGNTCYMNTCLQNLIHSKEFIYRLLAKKNLIDDEKTPISKEFYNLCEEIATTKKRAISPDDFKYIIGRGHPQLRGTGQFDTQEFCRILLEDINRELNEVEFMSEYKELSTTNKTKIECDKDFDNLFRSRENSIIVDSFYGQIINIFTCKCKFESYSFQKILDFPLLLPSKKDYANIKDLIADYFDEEEVKFSKKCENCKSKTVHKKIVRMSQPPNILILSLQRINERTKKKNNCEIEFSEELNLKKYIDEDCGHKSEYKYYLYGIGHHSGTINFGHYYANIKIDDKIWYEFNDSKVKEIGDKIDTKSNSVYVLFYKKRI